MRYRTPLHAAATSHFPLGSVIYVPSRNTGIFVSCSALTVKAAVKCIMGGIRSSPMGTREIEKGQWECNHARGTPTDNGDNRRYQHGGQAQLLDNKHINRSGQQPQCAQTSYYQ